MGWVQRWISYPPGHLIKSKVQAGNALVGKRVVEMEMWKSDRTVQVTGNGMLPEWFPVFDEQGGGHEEEVSSSRQWPSVRRSGNDLVVSGPQGDLNLVMVPERAESEAVEVAHCTNQPPLGATCQEVVRVTANIILFDFQLAATRIRGIQFV